jgi:uracil phosphoribosyltransferase
MSRVVVSNHPLIQHKLTLLRHKDTEPSMIWRWLTC